MSVTEIRARFRRSVQPLPYESVEGEISVVEHIEEGRVLADSDVCALEEHLLTTAKWVVYRTLGLDVAPPMPHPNASPEEAKTVDPGGDYTSPGDVAPGDVAPPEPPPEPAKRKRRSKAEMVEARAAEAAVKAASEEAADQKAIDEAAALAKTIGGADDIPGDDTVPSAGSPNDDTVPPSDVPGDSSPPSAGSSPNDDSMPPEDDTPGDNAPTDAAVSGDRAMTKIEFHELVNDTAVAVGVAPVKDVLKEWGVIRSGDIAEGDRVRVKVQLDALVIAKRKTAPVAS